MDFAFREKFKTESVWNLTISFFEEFTYIPTYKYDIGNMYFLRPK